MRVISDFTLVQKCLEPLLKFSTKIGQHHSENSSSTQNMIWKCLHNIGGRLRRECHQLHPLGAMLNAHQHVLVSTFRDTQGSRKVDAPSNKIPWRGRGCSTMPNIRNPHTLIYTNTNSLMWPTLWTLPPSCPLDYSSKMFQTLLTLMLLTWQRWRGWTTFWNNGILCDRAVVAVATIAKPMSKSGVGVQSDKRLT